uniref:Uncharacterized protein n=1 Tax=Arundo donax TaxID=35708 RepID=A0A0A9BPP9_ARUDO
MVQSSPSSLVVPLSMQWSNPRNLNMWQWRKGGDTKLKVQ